MIVVIRISGLVEVDKDVNETLFRMRLRRKYTATLLKESPENLKLLNHVRNFVAFGPVKEDVLVELIGKRGISLDKKNVDAKKIAETILKKGFEDSGIKPYFRLHPPRGGINTKSHYPVKKGVLGDNKDSINDLIRRML